MALNYMDHLKCFELISQNVHLCIKSICYSISVRHVAKTFSSIHCYVSFSFYIAVGLSLPSKT